MLTLGAAEPAGPQGHVQPDNCPLPTRVQFHPIADLVDEPEAVAAGGVGVRRLTGGQRVGDDAGILDLTNDLVGVAPDLH